jgi:hypothetical protein
MLVMSCLLHVNTVVYVVVLFTLYDGTITLIVCHV